MGDVKGGQRPGLVRTMVVGLVSGAVTRVNAPVKHGYGHVGLHLGALQPGDGSRVVGYHRRVVAAGYKSAGKAHAACAVFHDGEAFGADARRHRKAQGTCSRNSAEETRSKSGKEHEKTPESV